MASTSSKDMKDLYESDDYVGRYHDEAGERINRLIPFMDLTAEDMVLDIGCGNGLTLPLIADQIKFYEGIDFSAKFIKEAKKRAKELKIDPEKYKYVCGDVIKAYKKDKRKFDKVVSFDVTEHINDEELVEIFGAVKNVMQKGGKLYAHTPNKDFILERIKSEDQRVNKQGHIGLRNAQEYVDIFKSIGFSEVEVVPLPHYIRSLKPLHLLSYLPFGPLSSLFQARLLIICTK